MINIFTKHTHNIGESYWVHMKFAFSFGSQMFLGGIACMIHAIFPFMFEKSGSDVLLRLTQRFVERMPTVETRVALLGSTIKEKMKAP